MDLQHYLHWLQVEPTHQVLHWLHLEPTHHSTNRLHTDYTWSLPAAVLRGYTRTTPTPWSPLTCTRPPRSTRGWGRSPKGCMHLLTTRMSLDPLSPPQYNRTTPMLGSLLGPGLAAV
jgi:hypothetical protein